MRIDSYLEDQSGEGGNVSPFAGMTEILPESSVGQAEEVAGTGESPFESFFPAESPFTGETYDEALETEQAVRDFLESIHDEDFEDALEDLLNEGAARSLADAQQWSVAPSQAEAYESLEQWMAPLVTEWERTVDGFAAGLENAELAGMPEQEFDELLESLENPGPMESELFGRIVRGLANKAKSLVKGAVKFAANPLKGVVDIAKRGVGVLKDIGKGLLGPILERLKKAGIGLLKGVLKKLVRPLTRMLPPEVRPFVPIITKALGIGEDEYGAETAYGEFTSGGFMYGEDGQAETDFAAELAGALDREIAALLFSPEVLAPGTDGSGFQPAETYGTYAYQEDSEAVATFETLESLEDLESGGNVQGEDPVAALDDARARLAARLGEYSGAEGPVGPIRIAGECAPRACRGHHRDAGIGATRGHRRLEACRCAREHSGECPAYRPAVGGDGRRFRGPRGGTVCLLPQRCRRRNGVRPGLHVVRGSPRARTPAFLVRPGNHPGVGCRRMVGRGVHDVPHDITVDPGTLRLHRGAAGVVLTAPVPAPNAADGLSGRRSVLPGRREHHGP